MKYTHVVFDIDGTITDTEEAVLLGLIKMIRKWRGEEKTIEELRFTMGIPGAEALRLLGFAPEEVAPAMRDWEDGLREHNDEIEIFPGVEALIDALRSKGCRLGIATSKTRDQYEKDFARFAVEKKFGVSITADDSQRHKPTGGPLEKYMELTGAKAEEILYIGDAIYDQLCARDAGVDFALAVWGARDSALEAEYREQTPQELAAALGLSV